MFRYGHELAAHCAQTGKTIAEVAIEEEMQNSECSRELVFAKLARRR